MMQLWRWAFVVTVFAVVRPAIAEDVVGVSGSDVKYPTFRETKLEEKTIKFKLTGAAMRKKAIFNVYTVGSYVRDDFQGKTAEDLAGTDTLKQLHLVIQRTVSGEDMANAFRDAIRANYSDGFSEELEKLTTLMKSFDVEKGNEVWITNYPGYGLNVNLVGKKSEFIKGTKFAKAVWDIYLGPKNVGESVKKALISRL